MVTIYLAQYEAAHGKKKRELEHQLGKKLILKGLEELYGIIPEFQDQLVILEGEHGKPYLGEYPQIHYNISHTDGMVACGIGDRQLGIDVERIRPFHGPILKKVFSGAERRRMEEIRPEEHSEYFFRIWTLKESYVKAAGCGITIPLTDISFEWKEDGTLLCSVPGVSFQQKILKGGYVLSICTFGDDEINFEPGSVSSI